MVVSLPFVLLLLDYWPLCRWKPGTPNLQLRGLGKLVLEKLPLFLLSAAECIATLWAQTDTVADLGSLPLRERLINAASSYALYLGKIFWPTNLAFYPYSDRLSVAAASVSLFLLAGISVIVLWQRQKQYILVGWLWFLGTLVPVIGLVQVGYQSMADRYAYIPSIGIFIATAWAVTDMIVSLRIDTKMARMRPKWPFIGAAFLLFVLAVCTHHQLEYWHDNISLFSHSIRVNGSTPSMEHNLAFSYYKLGDREQALAHYRKVVELPAGKLEAQSKLRARARMNLADILVERGSWSEAVTELRLAVNEAPEFWTARSNLGDCLTALGRFEDAVAEYWTALQLGGTNNSVVWRQLGIALGKSGKGDEALKAYRKALSMRPNGTQELNELAWFLATDPRSELRNGHEAVRLATQACELTQNQEPHCLGTLDAAYAEVGRFEEAITTARLTRELALAKGQTDLATTADQRLKLYEAGKPYHQSLIKPETP